MERVVWPFVVFVEAEEMCVVAPRSVVDFVSVGAVTGRVLMTTGAIADGAGAVVGVAEPGEMMVVAVSADTEPTTRMNARRDGGS